MKKRKLRPWVKVALMFVIGVVAVSQVFHILGASASTDQPESNVYHGIIRLSQNGESDLWILEKDFPYDQEISVKNKRGYQPLEMVTVVMEGEKIVKDYKTGGEELDSVEKKFQPSITTLRRNIVDALYE